MGYLALWSRATSPKTSIAGYPNAASGCGWQSSRKWGCRLPEPALEVLRNVSDANPTWRLADDDRDEFSMWMEGSRGEAPIQNEDEFLTADDAAIIAQLTNFPAGDDICPTEVAAVGLQESETRFPVDRRRGRSAQWPADLWGPILQG